MSESKKQVYSKVADFYDDKCVLITGAAGYLGVILLETLLRTCPGIRAIYILLRPKRGVQPEYRKEIIFKKKIFYKLHEKNPDVFKKVHVVAGDVTQSNLGMDPENLISVIDNVNVVFHVAASISFIKSYAYMIENNAIATYHVINLCKKLKNLDVLVYTSTAYSNCNRKPEIEEQVYRLPYSANRFLDEYKSGNTDKLMNLVAQCIPTWPNSYTFSKCLAENFILENSTEVPAVIIRPSIIVSCWKGVLPGYVEEGSGMVDLGIAVAKGFVRVIRADPQNEIDIVPADLVANVHIVSAWSFISNKVSSPFVVNCTTGDSCHTTMQHYIATLMKMVDKHPLPKTYQKPSVKIVKNKYIYKLLTLLEHYAPASIIDIALSLSGKKLRLVGLYRFFDNAMQALFFFVTNQFDFETKHLKNLAHQISSKDEENLYVDVKGFSVESMATSLPYGAPFYQWEIDRKPINERKRVTNMRYYFSSLIKSIIIAAVILVVFMILSPISSYMYLF